MSTIVFIVGQEQYKGIDVWKLREPEDFYGKAAA